MKAHRVLVTAVGGNIGQGVVKALRNSNRLYHISGIDMESLSAGFSMVDAYYQTIEVNHPHFKDNLKKIIRKEQVEAIYVSSPRELEFYSINKQELEQELDVIVLVNTMEVIRICSDKLKTAHFLRDAFFPYPKTVSVTDEEGLYELIRTCGFPLIIKPRAGFTSKNIFIVNSLEEILAVRTLIPDLIIQQYLSDPASEYTATVLSGPDKKARASIVLHRDLNQGTTYRTELIEDDNITKQVLKIANTMGNVCACNIQFRLIDGTVFVFEINPRFSGTAGIRYLYGFNDAEMSFELFRLGLDICQPELSNAVILRYWNEVYIPDATFHALRIGSKQHCGIQTICNKPAQEELSEEKEQHKEEVELLDKMADKYFTEKACGPDRKQISFIMAAVLPYCTGPTVLELGFGSGHWTQSLLDLGFEVTVVEGSSSLAKACKDRFGDKVKVIHSLFEEFVPEKPYHAIIASCVLEHVENTERFLSCLKSFLIEGGNLHLIVPNALSLHRRIGLKMGMLKFPLELSPQEIEVGHRHAYTKEIFMCQLKDAGFKVNFIRGVFVKPLSSSQMMSWDDKLFEAYNELSDELPEYTAFLYASCLK